MIIKMMVAALGPENQNNDKRLELSIEGGEGRGADESGDDSLWVSHYKRSLSHHTQSSDRI